MSKATPAPLPDLNQQLLAWPEGTGTGLPNGRGSALIRSDGHGLDLTHDNRTWHGSPPNSARYFISTHMRPDGDALGSALGLAYTLRQLGKESLVVSPSPLPPRYINVVP
ncbi:MAG: hypothetical protein MUD05_11445, partial [Candidatus Nanopelagicales bacterium]|nr:hypothetical protein [Candidatus Nanopelagicales bacterium]